MLTELRDRGLVRRPRAVQRDPVAVRDGAVAPGRGAGHHAARVQHLAQRPGPRRHLRPVPDPCRSRRSPGRRSAVVGSVRSAAVVSGRGRRRRCERLADEHGVDRPRSRSRSCWRIRAAPIPILGTQRVERDRGRRDRRSACGWTGPSGTSCTRRGPGSSCRDGPLDPATGAAMRTGGRLVRRAVRRRRRAARGAGAAPAELVRALPRHRARRPRPGLRQHPVAVGLPARASTRWCSPAGVAPEVARPHAPAGRGALRRDVAAAAGPPARHARPDAGRWADDQHHLVGPAGRSARVRARGTAAPPRSCRSCADCSTVGRSSTTASSSTWSSSHPVSAPCAACARRCTSVVTPNPPAQVAAEHADVFLTWPDTEAAVAELRGRHDAHAPRRTVGRCASASAAT